MANQQKSESTKCLGVSFDGEGEEASASWVYLDDGFPTPIVVETIGKLLLVYLSR